MEHSKVFSPQSIKYDTVIMLLKQFLLVTGTENMLLDMGTVYKKYTMFSRGRQHRLKIHEK